MTALSDLTKPLPYCKPEAVCRMKGWKEPKAFNRPRADFQLYLGPRHRQLHQRYQCRRQGNVFQVFSHLIQLQ